MIGNLYLGIGKFIAAGDKKLGLDQIDIGNHFGNRVLDLYTWVDLHKINPAIIVYQKLDRTYIIVINGLADVYGVFV